MFYLTIITFQIPKFIANDTELHKIIFSYLDSLQDFNSVISIIKLNDTILQRRAYRYYQQIIDIEMDLRNILTYIITYDSKRIVTNHPKNLKKLNQR